MPIFCQKIVHSHKNTLLSYNFVFEFSMKNPLVPCPYLVQKSQFSQNYTILWQKIVIRLPFSSELSWKNYCPNAHVPQFFLAIFGNLVPIYCYKPTRVFLPIKISLYDYCYNFRNIATHNIGIIFSFLVTFLSFKNYWYMKYWYIFENEKLSVHAILPHFSSLQQ